MAELTYTQLRVSKMSPVSRVRYERNLDTIYDETTDHLDRDQIDCARRYRVKGHGAGFDWGVWDERDRRYLSTDEIAALTEQECREFWDGD